MENIVFIPGLLMAVCVISCVLLMFKIKNESLNAPSLIKFFGLEVFLGQYLTEKGKLYRNWYWRLFLSAFIFAAATVFLMYLFVPEFQQEFSGVVENV